MLVASLGSIREDILKTPHQFYERMEDTASIEVSNLKRANGSVVDDQFDFNFSYRLFNNIPAGDRVEMVTEMSRFAAHFGHSCKYIRHVRDASLEMYFSFVAAEEDAPCETKELLFHYRGRRPQQLAPLSAEEFNIQFTAAAQERIDTFTVNFTNVRDLPHLLDGLLPCLFSTFKLLGRRIRRLSPPDSLMQMFAGLYGPTYDELSIVLTVTDLDVFTASPYTAALRHAQEEWNQQFIAQYKLREDERRIIVRLGRFGDSLEKSFSEFPEAVALKMLQEAGVYQENPRLQFLWGLRSAAASAADPADTRALLLDRRLRTTRRGLTDPARPASFIGGGVTSFL